MQILATYDITVSIDAPEGLAESVDKEDVIPHLPHVNCEANDGEVSRPYLAHLELRDDGGDIIKEWML